MLYGPSLWDDPRADHAGFFAEGATRQGGVALAYASPNILRRPLGQRQWITPHGLSLFLLLKRPNDHGGY